MTRMTSKKRNKSSFGESQQREMFFYPNKRSATDEWCRDWGGNALLKNKIGPMKLLLLAPVWSGGISNTLQTDSSVRPGRQSAAFEDRTSGKHKRSCLTTPLGLEEQEMEMDGGKVRARGEEDGVRHQQRKTERHGGMQLLLQAWNPLIRQVCSSSPSSQPQAGGFLWLTGMWAASPRGGEERLGVCPLIDDPQTLIWSEILRNTPKLDNIRNG